MKRTRFLLVLDTILFVALVLLIEPRLAVLAVHEWLGLAVIPLIVVHLLYAWRWIAASLARLGVKGAWRLRVNAVLNTALFVAFTVATFSGLMTSFCGPAGAGDCAGKLWHLAAASQRVDFVRANPGRAAYRLKLGLDRGGGAAGCAGAPHRAGRRGPGRPGCHAAGGNAMTQAVRRAGLRIGLVCLAAGMVVAAAYVLTPRVDLKKEEAALMGRAANRAPLPGSEAALRQAIAETRGGAPDYDRIRAARI